jgi:hypothetical protein
LEGRLDPVNFAEYLGIVVNNEPSPNMRERTFVLEQNYPNPFNNETTIKIYMPRNSKVELSVYNLLGEKIRMLYNDRISAGFHTFRWDGKGHRGEPLPSAIYFYQLRSGKEFITKKMFLLK